MSVKRREGGLYFAKEFCILEMLNDRLNQQWICSQGWYMAQDSEHAQDFAARIERLESLLTISRLMNATSNQERLINGIAREIATYVEADQCLIFFHSRLTDELYTHIVTGSEQDTQIRIPSNRGIAGHVFNRRCEKCFGCLTRPLFFRCGGGYETHTILAYPLHNRRKEVIGVHSASQQDG